MRKIQFGFGITKFDAEQRIVGGIATAADLDRQGDIIPYEVALAAFAKAAETMGIREMHQPKAVGRLESYEGLSDQEAIYIEVYLSKSTDGEDALIKVQEGVLKGFSLGGNAPASHRNEIGANVIDVLEITETSLVDVPAHPKALITVVKLADSEEGTVAKPRSVRKTLSYNDIYNKLGDAVRDRCQAERPMESDVWGWVDDFGPDWVVYHDGSKLVRCGWGRAGDEVFLGSLCEEVEETYVPVSSPSDDGLGSEFGGIAPSTAGTSSQTTEVFSMDPKLLQKFALDIGVTKALMDRGVAVTKGDLASTINSVKELLNSAGSDPAALEQAQAALSVAAEMADKIGDSSAPTSPPASTPAASDSVDKDACKSVSGSDGTPATNPSLSADSVVKDEEPAAEAEPVVKDADPAPEPAAAEPVVEKEADPAPASAAEPVEKALDGAQNAPGAPAPSGFVSVESIVAAIRGAAGDGVAPAPVSKTIGADIPTQIAGDPIVKCLRANDFDGAVKAADGDTSKVKEIAMALAKADLAGDMVGIYGHR